MSLADCPRCHDILYIGKRQATDLRCPTCGSRLAVHMRRNSGEPPPRPFARPPLPVAEPGSYPRGGRTYGSLPAFMGARPQRLCSPERDVGLHWRDGAEVYRAAWIRDTGEVYLVQLGAPEHGGGHVELLTAGLVGTELERVVEGWRAVHDARGDRHSLAWLRERVAAAGRGRPRPAFSRA